MLNQTKYKAMKKVLTLLAMLLVATTSFSQTSRSPANSRETTGERSKDNSSTGSASAFSNSARSNQPATDHQTVQPDQTESRNSSGGYSTRSSPRNENDNGSQRQEPGSRNNDKANDRESNSYSTPYNTPRSSTSAAEREEPVTSNDRPGTSRVKAAHNGSQRQEPVSTSNRQGNEQVNDSPSERDIRPGRGNKTNGAACNVPARHDGSVNKGTFRQSEKTVYDSPRKSDGHREVRHHYNEPPYSREYRSQHYPYPIPVQGSIFWTPEMQIDYESIYPMVTYWDYPEGYRIETISSYDAFFYGGEVVNVYGMVMEVYYSRSTDEYILYFGAYYPYHDFTVVIPGKIARRISYRPERYFEFQYVTVTGLITLYDGVPEIYINRTYQIMTY